MEGVNCPGKQTGSHKFCSSVNEYIFRGGNSCIFNFASKHRDQLLKKGICSRRSKFLPLSVDPIIEKAASSRRANSQTQKLFPFVKMAENHGGVPMHLKTFSAILMSYCHF